MKKNESLECCLCFGKIEKVYLKNKFYWETGNSALPLKCGRCCDSCNRNYIIPIRLERINNQSKKEKLIV